MAVHEYRVVSTERYEWLLPKGSTTVELDAAQDHAHGRFFEVVGRPASYDDDIRVTANDESIIVYFVHDQVR